MSSVLKTFSGSSTKTYIAMRAYNNDIFAYTVTTADLVTTGTFSPVVGATSVNCPKGAFLRGTGQRLFPGANPGVSTLMVGVFDHANGLNGFIDPNSFAFSPQITDRPYYMSDNGTNPNAGDAPKQANLGAPVYTHGDVIADGALTVGSGANVGGAFVYKSLTDMTIAAGNAYPSMSTIDCSLGNVWLFHVSSAAWTLNATNVSTGQPIWVYFSTTGAADPAAIPVLTMGQNVREVVSGTGAAQGLTLMSTNSALMTFIGMGNSLVETSRIYVNAA